MTYHLTSVQATGLAVLAVWELIWKGLALWRASRKGQKVWYVFILIINSVGILPIIYLLLNRDE